MHNLALFSFSFPLFFPPSSNNRRNECTGEPEREWMDMNPSELLSHSGIDVFCVDLEMIQVNVISVVLWPFAMRRIISSNTANGDFGSHRKQFRSNQLLWIFYFSLKWIEFAFVCIRLDCMSHCRNLIWCPNLKRKKLGQSFVYQLV